MVWLKRETGCLQDRNQVFPKNLVSLVSLVLTSLSECVIIFASDL